MSLEFRQKLVANSKLQFTNESQKQDLLDPTKTKTGLVAMLQYVLDHAQFGFKLTAVKTDHHDDSALGPHSHFDGQAVDGWPIDSNGIYLDANDLSIWIEDIDDCNFIYQVGLAGSAYTQDNMELLGDKGFQDSGADHIHLGAIIL